MGAGPTKFQLSLLPGKPRKFEVGSRVAVWEMGRIPGEQLQPDTAKVIAVGPKHYDVEIERNGEASFRVPYYMLSYPNETRTWGAFFREGQRVLYKRCHPCVLINVDRLEDGGFHLALRSLKTGKISNK